MIVPIIRCIKCNKAGTVDLRYLWSSKLKTYELEYHCTTLEGGCNFYRILPLHHKDGDE